MFKEKKSFFDRLTGIVNTEPEEVASTEENAEENKEADKDNWMEEENSEGQLTVDVYQTPSEIIIQAMVAGVKPDDLDVSISREMVTLKGKREQSQTISEENFFYQELYWGSFSRTILLPQEIEVEEAEATERNGLLTIRLPKIDKKKTQQLKVKTR